MNNVSTPERKLFFQNILEIKRRVTLSGLREMSFLSHPYDILDCFIYKTINFGKISTFFSLDKSKIWAVWFLVSSFNRQVILHGQSDYNHPKNF